MINKTLFMLLLSTLVVGCNTQQTHTEDGLREAYRNCIQSAEGSSDKIAACQTVLEVMRKHEKHRDFAEKETVRVLDYQRCLTARQTGGAQAIQNQCGKVWQEIRDNN